MGGTENPIAYQAAMTAIQNIEVWAFAIGSGALAGLIGLLISGNRHRHDHPKRIKSVDLNFFRQNNPRN